MITKELMTKLCEEAYMNGQIDGIKLTCNQLSEAILQFRDKIVEEYKKKDDK